MLSLFEIAALLLVLSAILAWLNRAYFKLPVMPSIGLTDTLQSAIKQIDFNETLMKGMLGFLLFAGALHVDFGKIRDAKWAIGSMATIGVIMSTFIVGTGFYYIAKMLGVNLPYIWALVFGALISPTDPVAVLSILKSVKMPKALESFLLSTPSAGQYWARLLAGLPIV